MSIKGVIFDHDGTLVDSERCHYHIWRELLHSYGLSLEEKEYVQKFSGVPTITNALYLVENYTLSCDLAKLSQEKQQRTDQYFNVHHAPLMNYAEECIKQCQILGLKLAIATGADGDMVKNGIGKSEFYSLFSSIASSDRVNRNKPAPDVYLLAQRELGLEPDQVVAIEDSPTGISAAKAANMLCVAVENSYSKNQDLSQADFLAKDLRQASQIIKGMCH